MLLHLLRAERVGGVHLLIRASRRQSAAERLSELSWRDWRENCGPKPPVRFAAEDALEVVCSVSVSPESMRARETPSPVKRALKERWKEMRGEGAAATAAASATTTQFVTFEDATVETSPPRAARRLRAGPPSSSVVTSRAARQLMLPHVGGADKTTKAAQLSAWK